MLGVQGTQVRLGVTAPAELHILREELRSRTAGNLLPQGAGWRLARKLKVLMFLNRHSTQSLALASGLLPSQVLAAENGEGVVLLDDLEKIAQVLGVKGGGVVLRAGADSGGAGGVGVVGGGGG